MYATALTLHHSVPHYTASHSPHYTTLHHTTPHRTTLNDTDLLPGPTPTISHSIATIGVTFPTASLSPLLEDVDEVVLALLLSLCVCVCGCE
jgi:hypothetical protein